MEENNLFPDELALDAETPEQWKEGALGDCLRCRRHGYCKTMCKNNKRRAYRAILSGMKKRKALEAQANTNDLNDINAQQ